MSDKTKAKKAKKPLQIYLDQGQLDALRYQADRNGKSMAHLIRESVAMYLAQLPLEQDPAMSIIGIGSSKEGDLSAKHDKYLVEEFEKQHNNFELEPDE